MAYDGTLTITFTDTVSKTERVARYHALGVAHSIKDPVSKGFVSAVEEFIKRDCMGSEVCYIQGDLELFALDVMMRFTGLNYSIRSGRFEY